MSWGALLLGVAEFIRSLPAIMKALMELKQLWDQSIEVGKRKEKMKELASVLERAKQTKNTTELESFFRDFTK